MGGRERRRGLVLGWALAFAFAFAFRFRVRDDGCRLARSNQSPVHCIRLEDSEGEGDEEGETGIYFTCNLKTRRWVRESWKFRPTRSRDEEQSRASAFR